MAKSQRQRALEFLKKRWEHSLWDNVSDSYIEEVKARELPRLKERIDLASRMSAKEVHSRFVAPVNRNPEFPRPPGYGELRGWATVDKLLVEGNQWKFMLVPAQRKNGIILQWMRQRSERAKTLQEFYTYPGYDIDTPPAEVIEYLRNGGQGRLLNYLKGK